MRLLLILLPLLCFGQSQNVVHQKLFTDRTTTGASVNVTNIGQSSHLAAVTVSNQPTKTCALSDSDLGFESSYDNLSWTPIGANIQGILAIRTALVKGDGAYPFVRFNLRSFDTVNCQLTVWYTGSLYPLTNETLLQDVDFDGRFKQAIVNSAVGPVLSLMTFVGAGLNDLSANPSVYSTPVSTATIYCVKIDATGTPDTFSWGTGASNCVNGATGVAITGAGQTLSLGVTITFAATTGHTLNNSWTFTVGEGQTTLALAVPNNQIAVYAWVITCTATMHIQMGDAAGIVDPSAGSLSGTFYVTANTPFIVPFTGFSQFVIDRPNRALNFYQSASSRCTGYVLFRYKRLI